MAYLIIVYSQIYIYTSKNKMNGINLRCLYKNKGYFEKIFYYMYILYKR